MTVGTCDGELSAGTNLTSVTETSPKLWNFSRFPDPEFRHVALMFPPLNQLDGEEGNLVSGFANAKRDSYGKPSFSRLTRSIDYKYIVVLMIGEFEYLILTASASLGEEAYGAAIRDFIEDAGQRCSIGALYTTLDRLENKGLIKTRMGEPTPERGGRAKRLVRVTAAGVQAASEFYEAIRRVSRGVSWETNRGGIQ